MSASFLSGRNDSLQFHLFADMPFEIPQARRHLALDVLLGSSLILIAVTLYAAMFIHVPLLTEVRDFVLRFGQDARLIHVFVPSGNDYRPLSWKLFAWQQQLLGFQPELFNLVQFCLLGLCAFVGYIHLRQLVGHRMAAFGGSVLWLLSLPVADAAFWQATQHDKLAFLFTILALIVTLHGLRSERVRHVSIYVVLTLILVALAVATKPIAFMLPIALIAQFGFLDRQKTRAEYLRIAGLLVIPAAYVGLYAVVYAFETTPEWRAHTMSGNRLKNLLIYSRNITNIDHDGNLVLAVSLCAAAGAVWAYALLHISNSVRRVLVYLFVLFSASISLLTGAAHASSFYLLLPLFAFTGSLATLAVSFSAVGRGWVRRAAVAVVVVVVVGLLANYGVVMSGRLQKLAWSGQHLSEGYKIIRSMVDPERLKAIRFYFRRKPTGYFFFFSDGTHKFIDPMIPSFIFGRRLDISIYDATGTLPSDVPADELVAVWANDLQLMELRLSGAAIYGRSIASLGLSAYRPGQTLAFQRGGNAKQFQREGWSREEDWGTWTDGTEATLLIRLRRDYHTPLEMIAWAKAFVASEHPKQVVHVFANGHLIAEWSFQHGDSLTESRARIPAELVESDSLQLSFRMLNPRSPESLGLSGDSRALGIMLQQLRLDPAEPGDRLSVGEVRSSGAEAAPKAYSLRDTPESGDNISGLDQGQQ